MYLYDTQTPELIEEAPPYVIEIVRQAGIAVTDEMDHFKHDHGLLINDLHEKMQDWDTTRESSETT